MRGNLKKYYEIPIFYSKTERVNMSEAIFSSMNFLIRKNENYLRKNHDFSFFRAPRRKVINKNIFHSQLSHEYSQNNEREKLK